MLGTWWWHHTTGTSVGITGASIGIDLGTTYLCVGIWQNDRTEIISNAEGNRKTPSYVGLTETGRLVGDGAKNQMEMNPTNTVFDANRLMGRRFNDPTVVADMKYWPFKVVEGPGNKPVIEVTFRGELKQFAPEEIDQCLATTFNDCQANALLRQQPSFPQKFASCFNHAS